MAMETAVGPQVSQSSEGRALPRVAIVGRPNVGKSTLLNRLVGRRQAIVSETPGTTRDRLYAEVSWEGQSFTLIDTGGLEMVPESGLLRQVKGQVEFAAREAEAIVFLVDATEGITVPDLEIAGWLRRLGKPVVLAVNKADNLGRARSAVEFYELGLGEPLPISAYHGRGVDQLLDRLISLLPGLPRAEAVESIKVAIVGRPNVGKSLLLNAILGQERSIVSEQPGTTRDAIDTLLGRDGQMFLLIDTAGLRRPGRVQAELEKYSVIRAKQAIDRCDVALLVIEAPAGITAQDTHIAGSIHQAFKGIVIVVNKWDLVSPQDNALYINLIQKRLRFQAYAPVLFVSALTGMGVEAILPKVEEVYAQRLKRLTDVELDELLREALATHSPPSTGPKRVRFYSMKQTGVNPPTFECRVSSPKLVHFTYQRYLENRLRQTYGFLGTPLRLVFKVGRGG